jgi:hypothetical protein
MIYKNMFGEKLGKKWRGFAQITASLRKNWIVINGCLGKPPFFLRKWTKIAQNNDHI